MADKSENTKRPESKTLERVVADAIEISERFSAEPIFGPTAKGHLKSEGVKPLRDLKKKGEDR